MSYAMKGLGTYGGGGYAGFGYAGFGAVVDFSKLGASPPLLKQGMPASAAVTLWQTFLGSPIGPFGPKTYAATVAFQKAHGLKADGAVGHDTWMAAIASQGGGGGGGAPAPAPGTLPGMQPDGTMVVPAGGGTTAPAPSGGAAATTANPLDKAKAWWGAQPKNTQYAIMGGGGVVVLGLLFLMMSGGKKKPAAAMTPNRRARSYAHYGTRAKKRRRRGALLRRRRAAGYVANRARACAPMKKRVKSCHCKPPKKYRRKGATARADYAFPECYMYPIRFRKKGKVRRKLTVKHIRTAASRIGKFGRRYPAQVRKRIKSRIRAAERKYGIGPYRSR